MFPETEFHCTFTTPSIHPLSAPTAMKQGTRRRMEQPINACGQFVCFTATCEIRKFLLMRFRWRVCSRKSISLLYENCKIIIVVVYGSSDRPTDLPETLDEGPRVDAKRRLPSISFGTSRKFL